MKNIYIFILMCVLFFTACGENVSYELSGSSISESAFEEIKDTKSQAAESDASSEEQFIYVYICGEVASPGVYKLKEGSRVYEAIEAAGGLIDGVDTTNINMARQLVDSEQITVTFEGEESQESASSALGGTKKVNINTASKEELMTLSGIGEARADSIIEYRTRYGGFSSAEDLMNISGIGEKMFEKIKDEIEV